MKKIKNASIIPQVYYGLHMCEGVAHYRPSDGEPYTIFVGEKTCKEMDPTYVGRPVYVEHVDEVDLENITDEADGYVVESFFNKPDGKHWSKFIVVSDKGHEAIRNGWKLSNAYIIGATAPGGSWHGVEYSTEVMKAEYEHLAIVRDPRYAESIILTPDQFKEYNTSKEAELKKLENSNDKIYKGESHMFKLFKKSKIENTNDINFDEMMITINNGKNDVSFQKLVNMAEELLEKKSNGDDKVKVGEEEMTVNELVKKYENMRKKNNEYEEEKKKNEDEDKEKKENQDEDEDKDKKENQDEEEKEEVKNKKKKNAADQSVADAQKVLNEAKEKQNNFNKIANAEMNVVAPIVEMGADKVKRGEDRYGSGS